MEKVRIQINKDILDTDEKIFKENNFTNKEIVELLYKQVLINHKLPVPLSINSRYKKDQFN